MIKIREVTYTQETRETVLRDIAEVKRVWLQSYKTTYSEPFSQSNLDSRTLGKYIGNLKQSFTQENLGNDQYLFVAELETGKMVGYAYCGRNIYPDIEFDSVLYELYLLKEYQGHKIGSELFNRSKSRLFEQGYQTMFLWCVEEIPSCKFYDKKLGERVKIKPRNGNDPPEIGFVWRLK